VGAILSAAAIGIAIDSQKITVEVLGRRMVAESD
jgi:hypothetical protein